VRSATLTRRKANGCKMLRCGVGFGVIGEQAIRSLLGYLKYFFPRVPETSSLGAVRWAYLYYKQPGPAMSWWGCTVRGDRENITPRGPGHFVSMTGLFATRIAGSPAELAVGKVPEGYMAFGFQPWPGYPAFYGLRTKLRSGDAWTGASKGPRLFELGLFSPSVGDHFSLRCWLASSGATRFALRRDLASAMSVLN